MGNVNDYRKGELVIISETATKNYRTANFPGWEDLEAAKAELKPLVAGMMGVVTSVESHGSNPWTRYSVEFANGGHASGLVAGLDFRWV